MLARRVIPAILTASIPLAVLVLVKAGNYEGAESLLAESPDKADDSSTQKRLKRSRENTAEEVRQILDAEDSRQQRASLAAEQTVAWEEEGRRRAAERAALEARQVTVRLLEVTCLDTNDKNLHGKGDEITLRRKRDGFRNSFKPTFEKNFKKGTRHGFGEKVIYSGTGNRYFSFVENDGFPSRDDFIGGFVVDRKQPKLDLLSKTKRIDPEGVPPDIWVLRLSGSGAVYEVRVLVQLH